VIELELPWPPSNNTYYRHVGNRTLLSKKGREYRELVKVLVHPMGMTGRIALFARLCPPDRRRRDLDNHFKALLDALVHAGVMADDEQIDHLVAIRGPVVKGGKITVKVGEIAA